MSEINKGTTFVDGNTYTASDFNKAFDSASVGYEVIDGKTVRSHLSEADDFLIEASGSLHKTTWGNLRANLAQYHAEYGSDTGVANAYELNLSPSPDAYLEGMTVRFKANSTNTGVSTVEVNSLGIKTIKKNVSQDLVEGDIQQGELLTLVYDGEVFQMEGKTPVPVMNHFADGRLTLSLGEPVTSNDITLATSLYYSPCKGNRVALFDGANWSLYAFDELSLDLSAFDADTNFDIFIYDNNGVLTLEETAWTDATTRSINLIRQDGVLVKSGETTRRYLGTIRTTGTLGECEDSETKRFVWNLNNRVKRELYLTGWAVNHSYQSDSVRSYNNDSSIKVEAVYGLSSFASIDVLDVGEEAGYGQTGIGVDDSTVFSSRVCVVGDESASVTAPRYSVYRGWEAPGHHEFFLVQAARSDTPGYWEPERHTNIHALTGELEG